MERSSSLHLFVILLGFYHLISLNAATSTTTTTTTTTGSRRLLQQEGQYLLGSDDTHQIITEENWTEELINGRMDLENHDYPGSGANKGHTPKPERG